MLRKLRVPTLVLNVCALCRGQSAPSAEQGEQTGTARSAGSRGISSPTAAHIRERRGRSSKVFGNLQACLALAILGITLFACRPAKETRPEPGGLAEYSGHYQIIAGYTATIACEENSLSYRPTGQMYADLLLGDPIRGFYLDQEDWDARLFFEQNQMIIRKPGREIRCPRVPEPCLDEPPQVARTATEVSFAEQGRSGLLSSDSAVERTLQSLRRVGDLLVIDYSADYRRALEQADDWDFRVDPDQLEQLGFSCTIFVTADGEHGSLFGRNFDNAACGVLVGRYTPASGYASIVFTRTSDLGFAADLDPRTLTIDQRTPFLAAPFFIADGINERGLTLALAAHSPHSIAIDQRRDTIHLLRLCRMMLDEAGSINEAIALAMRYNVYDMRSSGKHLIEHHVLVADDTGHSAVLEGIDGRFQPLAGESRDWRVATNFPLHGLSEPQRRMRCGRYRLLAQELADSSTIDWAAAMNLLRRTSGTTSWSSVYDLHKRRVYIAVDKAYDDVYTAGFD
ncbi:linear amide C-N hydrolase, partial [Acidobacteriota bacterium]